jgi:hypothetical protein
MHERCCLPLVAACPFELDKNRWPTSLLVLNSSFASPWFTKGS